MKAIRPDFDYTCECGYYTCNACDYPMYPMEIEHDNDNDNDNENEDGESDIILGSMCPHCFEGTMYKAL